MNEVLPAIGCLALLLFGLPVWAIVEARRARREGAKLRASLAELTARVHVLGRRGVTETSDVPAGAASIAPAAPVATGPAPFPAVPASSRPTIPPVPITVSVPFPAAQPPSPVGAAFVPPSRAAAPSAAGTAALQAPAASSAPPLRPPPPAVPRKPLDWENLISVRAFAWLGGAALFLAMGLFLQYSIQHNLISPAARVAIGLLVGAVALAGGDWLRSKADWAGQATAGAGVAILYASLFAAHSRYALLGSTATFAGMALVTVAAGLLAARRGAFIVAVLGLIGGFLTPYLLATNEDRPVALLAYMLLLDVGAIAVSRSRQWVALQYLSLIGSVVLYVGWAGAHLDAEKAPYALAAAAVLASLFAVLGVSRRGPEEKRSGVESEAVPLLAAAGPLAAALYMSSAEPLAVSPAFLTGYLLVLALGAFFLSRRTGFSPLVPIAAAFSVATLAGRITPGLVANRTVTLLLFTTVPAAYLAIALFRREARTGTGTAERVAAAISLGGGFLILARFLELAPKEPVLPLWVFAAAHAAGLLAIGTVLASGTWIAGAQAFLYVCLLVLTTAFAPARLSEFLPLIISPAAVFWALPFLSARWRGGRYAWLSSAAAPILHFPVLFVLAKPAWGTDVLGAAAIVFAVASLLALKRATAILESPADRRFTTAIFGAVTLAFVTAAIPILLDKEWITVAWALEAAALAWLWKRVPQEGLVQVATGLAAASFFRLVANPLLWQYHARSGTRIFNWYLYTFGIPAAAFLVAAMLVRTHAWAERYRVPSILRAAAGILLFILLNVEIADFYSTGGQLRFRLSGGGLGEDVTYSLAWGAFAMILLALGITRGSRAMRAASLGVLLLTMGKVFLHDLWDLGALYRVGSILGLAVALLAVSFLTQRFVFVKERP